MPKKSIQWHCTTAEEWQSTGRTGKEESDARELWCGYEWPTNHQKYTQTETERVCATDSGRAVAKQHIP